jgi:hypothetical protein
MIKLIELQIYNIARDLTHTKHYSWNSPENVSLSVWISLEQHTLSSRLYRVPVSHALNEEKEPRENQKIKEILELRRNLGNIRWAKRILRIRTA